MGRHFTKLIKPQLLLGGPKRTLLGGANFQIILDFAMFLLVPQILNQECGPSLKVDIKLKL